MAKKILASVMAFALCLFVSAADMVVKGKNGEIRIMMHNSAKVNVENIPIFLKKHKDELSFQAAGTPTFFYKYVKTGIVEKDAENLLMYTSALLDEMEDILL